MPSPAEIEVEECAAPKQSYSLSARLEAGQAAAGAQCADAVTPSSHDLVRIRLMADIPDQLVLRRIEHIMQGNRQFDDAKARPQVAAGDGNHADGFGAQLVGNPLKVLCIDTAEVCRILYVV